MKAHRFACCILWISTIALTGCSLENPCGDDQDGDGFVNCDDICPFHADARIIDKNEFSTLNCTCEDKDEDGLIDCLDPCPEHANLEPTACGCGVPETDSDGDGTMDCIDQCPDDPAKSEPGVCGCDVPDSPENIADTDNDGTVDCHDACPLNPYKIAPGSSGCDDHDIDGDGVDDQDDICPYNPNISANTGNTDCNYFDDDQGNQVFGVYHAKDLERLAEETAKHITNTEGFICPENSGVGDGKCIGGTSAVICEMDHHLDMMIQKRVECSNNCEGYGFNCGLSCELRDWINDREGGTGPLQSSICCVEDAYIACDEGTFDGYWCKNGVIEKISCPKGCQDNRCGWNFAIGGIVSEGGPENSNCIYDRYKETCSGSSEAFRCNMLGHVYKSRCMTGCQTLDDNDDNVLCIEAESQPPLMRVKVMNDIELSDNITINNNPLGCYGDWKSIDLYRVEFDGNGKKIKFTDDYGRKICSITRPLFANVIESTVNNLDLVYNVRGLVSSSFARYTKGSQIHHIHWNGEAYIDSPIFGENTTIYGGLVAYARNSEFKSVGITGSLYANHEINAYGLLGNVDNIVLDNAKVNLSYLRSTNRVSSGLLGRLYGRNVIKNINENIENFEFGSELMGWNGSAYGVVRQLNRSSFYNIFVNIKTLKQMHDIATFGGMFSSLPAGAFLNVMDLSVDKLLVYDFHGGVTGGVYGKMSELKIHFGEVNSDEFAGIFRDITSGISRLDVTIDKITVEDEMAVFGNVYNPVTMDKVNVYIKNLDVKGSFLGLFDEVSVDSDTDKAIFSNFNIVIDDAESGYIFGNNFKNATVQQVNAYAGDVKKSIFMFNWFYDGVSLNKISFYANASNSSNKRPSCIFNVSSSMDSENPVLMSHIVSTTNMCKANGIPESDYKHGPYAGLVDTGQINVNDVYWLKQNDNDFAVGRDEADMTYEGLFTPYMISTSPNVVSLLGNGWSLREVPAFCQESSASNVSIPWYNVDMQWLDELNTKIARIKNDLGIE